MRRLRGDESRRAEVLRRVRHAARCSAGARRGASRAGRAAVAMQRACAALTTGAAGAIALRVAVNTGEVVVDAADSDVVGDPVNVAARLQQEAREGDVLIGESTRRLVADLVTLAPF